MASFTSKHVTAVLALVQLYESKGLDMRFWGTILGLIAFVFVVYISGQQSGVSAQAEQTFIPPPGFEYISQASLNSHPKVTVVLSRVKDRSKIPLPDLFSVMSSIESFDYDPTQMDEYNEVSSYNAVLHTHLTADEWLTYLKGYKNTIVPIAEIIDTLPTEVQAAVRECGAEYGQVVLSRKVWPNPYVANVFCRYVVTAESAHLFSQGSSDFIDTKTGAYYGTNLGPAVHTPDDSSPYDMIVLGWPTPDWGPFPFIGEGQSMLTQLRPENAVFLDAAAAISLASGKDVDPSEVTLFPWGENNFVMEAKVSGRWYYTEPHVGLNLSRFYSAFGAKNCTQVELTVLTHPWKPWVCHATERYGS